MSEMPPISNPVLYGYRVLMKWLSFLIFGLNTLLLVSIFFPVMTLFIHPKERFLKQARRFVSFAFRYFVHIMCLMGIVSLDAGDRDAYRRLSSKIVVANHPSLLDVVMLISLIPNADCIVRDSLKGNIVAGVIRRLYILNSLDFEKLAAACAESLNRGNCVIIFPEGTRTPRSGEMRLKKGAARLSLLSGRDIVPVHIGGTDKWGLGKNDPWTAFNHQDKYIYRVRIQDHIAPETFSRFPFPAAVRRLNQKIREVLLNPKNR
ncbi:MAG: 1-acyl-sn-glycerol-3-phosphate acyltransferase [Treponema sp.]|jgi:1-acyl-sn-glycerol-3-phosphate acyltransferase|nr:1-acyl-sn-glycerol-3-phosphate acyltransferase [Treponema sp.]